MSCSDEWFWITAGHLKSGLKDLERRGYELRSALYHDQGDRYQHPTPFLVSWDRWQDFDNGFADYCVVPLDDLVKEALARNERTPVHVTDVGFRSEECVIHLLIGSPAEWCEFERRDKVVEYKITSPVLNLLRSEDEQDANGFGRMVFDATLNDITCEGRRMASVKGMSGGLIVGVQERPDGHVYFGHAIQTGCRGLKTVYGCPLDIVAIGLHRWIKAIGK